jgi:hypothetical protein
VHLSEGSTDDRFSIVISNAADRIVYLHGAPQQVSVSLIRSQFSSFLGIVVGHGEVVPSEPRYTLQALPRAQDNLRALSGKQRLLLSLMRKIERKRVGSPLDPTLRRFTLGRSSSCTC